MQSAKVIFKMCSLLLQDLPEEPNILRRPNVIVNLSNYLHLIKDANGRKILFALVPQFEFFFEKVKHLPKVSLWGEDIWILAV